MFLNNLLLQYNFFFSRCKLSHFTPVIGLEIHAQLNCKTKLFSGASSGENVSVNDSVSLFDMATPGTLPRLNRQSVEQSLKTALLLNCQIAKWCRFDRKHYFYPDLPLGYQITQKNFPIAENGFFEFFVYSVEPFLTKIQNNTKKTKKSEQISIKETYIKRVFIERLQLEMDSGKLLKFTDKQQQPIELIDLNRAGTALVEIVTAPQFSSAHEAACFVEQIRILLLHNNICNGEMHKGNLRFDANVSLMFNGKNGSRTEIKNLNSIKDLENAINIEIDRHKKILIDGKSVAEETLTFDEKTMKVIVMRKKGDELDYRFIPETNLPPLKIDTKWIDSLRNSISFIMPYIKYITKYNFSTYFSIQIIKDEPLKLFIDKCLSLNDKNQCNLAQIKFDNFRFWLSEFKRICEQNGCNFPPKKNFLVYSFCDAVFFENESKITRALCFDLLKECVLISVNNNDNEFDFLKKKLNKENLWRILDKIVIKKFVEKIINENMELATKLHKNSLKVGNKHFNRLRNTIVIESKKKISVEDAEEALTNLLNQL